MKQPRLVRMLKENIKFIVGKIYGTKFTMSGLVRLRLESRMAELKIASDAEFSLINF